MSTWLVGRIGRTVMSGSGQEVVQHVRAAVADRLAGSPAVGALDADDIAVDDIWTSNAPPGGGWCSPGMLRGCRRGRYGSTSSSTNNCRSADGGADPWK